MHIVRDGVETDGITYLCAIPVFGVEEMMMSSSKSSAISGSFIPALAEVTQTGNDIGFVVEALVNPSSNLYTM